MTEQTNQQPDGNMNTVSLLTKVFTDPQQVFESLRTNPVWIVPIIITMAFGLVFTYSTQELQMEYSKNIINESQMIPETAKEAAIDDIENPTDFKIYYMPAITIVLMTFVIPLVIALVLLVFGNFVFGGSASYKTLFSASAWAGLIGVLEGIVKLPLMLSKGTMEVYTSLALLLDLDDSKTFLFQVLNLADVFVIWKIFVYSVAFSVIYKFSATKSYATIISLYLVYAFIGIGFAQMFM